MTIADQARNLAISLEAKKDALSQRQSGDWKVSFTVQGIDMDARLTQAPMGTRYAMVLVEIGDDELPVRKPAKEKEQHTPASQTPTLQPDTQPRPAGVVKRDWRDLQPAQQAGIRCGEPLFRAFLAETRNAFAGSPDEAAAIVRTLCGVNSRVELGTKHAARMLWHALDSEFETWKLAEQVGA